MVDEKKSVAKFKECTDKKYFIFDAPEKYPGQHVEPQATGPAIAMAYINYALIIMLGHLRDLFARVFQKSRYSQSVPPEGYAPLFKSWENFYTRRLYHRIQDCWNRPIDSAPGAHINIVVRKSDDGNKTLSITDERKSMVNLGSYNYLGFADDWQTSCKPHVLPVLEELPISCSNSRADFGTTRVHRELEILVARFLSKEDAVVFNMGFATNSSVIPMLAGKGTLLVSDTLNHMSIVSGCRMSGAHIRVFKHNSASDLESVLREAIVMGMPRSRRPWKKILVIIEGIYSMEGEIADLKKLVEVAKKYKAYIYLDEAHSIGALGRSGRGVCEYCQVDTKEVDILMGTFTKSFGGMGGYIASSKSICDYLRSQCPAFVHHNSLSPVVVQQVIVALRIIMGEDGSTLGAKKIKKLRDNANFVRARLEGMGLHVYGDYNSPIIPVMLYMPGKIAAFSRECYKRGLAVVVVGFPATSLLMSRTRICISAGHSEKDLEESMNTLEEVAKLCQIRYARNGFGF